METEGTKIKKKAGKKKDNDEGRKDKENRGLKKDEVRRTELK